MINKVLIVMAYVIGIHGTCLKLLPTLAETEIATMCHNSTVQGTVVYIDIDVSTTTTLTSGVACTCEVKAQTGKGVMVNTTFGHTEGTLCGTSVKFASPENSSEISCSNHFEEFSTSVYTNITVDLQKTGPPQLGDYCLQFALNYCDGQFQCDDLTCISSNLRCDGSPDCADEADEKSCSTSPGSCSEGLVRCDNGPTCIRSDDRCDSTYQCQDQSDESPKYCDPNYVDTGSGSNGTYSPPPPLITITCTESSFLPQSTTLKSTTTTLPPSPSITTSTITPTPSKTPKTTTLTTRTSTAKTDKTTTKQEQGVTEIDDTDNRDTGMIIGITIGCLVLIVVVLAIIYFVRQSKRYKKFDIAKIRQGIRDKVLCKRTHETPMPVQRDDLVY